ncbi:hypothetical protein P3G55_04915 [Leptospira sp. 96542]|nr:hypothetical protein [Leptospira sp. 96542]
MKYFFIIFFFGLVPLWPQWFSKKDNFESHWKLFNEKRIIQSDAYRKFGATDVRLEPIEYEGEFSYFYNLCAHEDIKELSVLYKLLSFYDATVLLKTCSESKKEYLPELEKIAKKRVFDLLILPKLEILESETNLENLSPYVNELKSEWEKTIYLYSNFYKATEVLYFGKEREFIQTINTTLYSEMPESRRKVAIQRLLEDLKVHNKSSYQLFLYSKQNPWSSPSLVEENNRSITYYNAILSDWENETEPIIDEKEKLQSLRNCLLGLTKKTGNYRLLAYYGFFYDYGRFVGLQNVQNQSKVSFIKRTIYQSHHFKNRLDVVLNSCKNTANHK